MVCFCCCMYWIFAIANSIHTIHEKCSFFVAWCKLNHHSFLFFMVNYFLGYFYNAKRTFRNQNWFAFALLSLEKWNGRRAMRMGGEMGCFERNRHWRLNTLWWTEVVKVLGGRGELVKISPELWITKKKGSGTAEEVLVGQWLTFSIFSVVVSIYIVDIQWLILNIQLFCNASFK